MRVLFLSLLIAPVFGFSQSATMLQLSMHDYSDFVIQLDAVKYDACAEVSINSIQPGEHQLKVYKEKSYFNTSDNTTTVRLIPVYSGEVVILENKCTTCVIDKFHQNNIVIK